jgi:hypothetical protein
MTLDLARLIFCAGIGQLGVLIASALVPLRLDWKASLRDLPRLHRQLFWVYGGYVVLSIVSLGMISLVCAVELAEGSRLARAVCLYAALFWGIRLSLQPFLAADEFATTLWLKAGYHVLTLLFASFTTIFGYAALH